MQKLLAKNQLLLLGLFYTNPKKSFYIQEIGRILGRKAGVFQRTLNRLAEQGILKSEYQARARYFRANTRHPLYPELRKIVLKTGGVENCLRELTRHQDIKLALLYGSFAKGKEREDSDIDLLIVGDPAIEDTLLKELPGLEKRLQREINYKWYSEKEYRRRRKQSDSFLEEVLGDKHIVLKGDPDAF